MGVFDNLLNKFKKPKEEESPRMKSAEAQKLTFAKLARKAQERTASDLSE